MLVTKQANVPNHHITKKIAYSIIESSNYRKGH